jgi:uncharacterized protein (DUF1778 family)
MRSNKRPEPSGDRKQASSILAKHEVMVLVGADRDAFVAAVTEPPEPTEKLVAALQRHRDLR